uniref:Uncharacterized protein n=1 Tax=Heliothis virescens TaxID=7102 RepID=A0A2A4JXA1_HELVI
MSNDDINLSHTPCTDRVQFTPESESFNDGGQECSSRDLSDDILTKSKQRRQELYSLSDTDGEQSSVASTDDALDPTYVPGSSSEADTDTSYESTEERKES